MKLTTLTVAALMAATEAQASEGWSSLKCHVVQDFFKANREVVSGNKSRAKTLETALRGRDYQAFERVEDQLTPAPDMSKQTALL